MTNSQGIEVRPLRGPDEFRQVEDVQMSAWGMGPREATPKDVMIAINDNGGVVLGAFKDGRVIGFALTLSGYLSGKVFLYSHMTGVSRGHQSQGVGYILKLKQREIALERGLDLIAWTFDPIISRNAHFNFTKLGVVARNYFVNYYGPMNDSINFGWETDRFLSEWYVTSEKQEQRTSDTVPAGAHVAIKKTGEEPFPRCVDWEIDLTAENVAVDIPSDVVALKTKNPEEGKRWRLGTREVFQKYFGSGYTASKLIETNGEYRYLLEKDLKLPRNIFAHGSTH